ncbi:MAG: type II secretion system protein [Alphaproteobacteria bacterium]
MKKQNLKKQTGVSPLMGKSVGNKDINAAGCPIRSGMTEYYESGRSMVEMLGVLAIMGVLSVGGVAMYTTAMNKHRANEILNEASKRATIVAGQLLSNPEAKTMSLAQFGNNTVAGATFGEEATISDNNITLTLSDVDEAICSQMKAALGDSTIMAVDDICGQITFNADMSRGVDANGGNGDNNAPCTETPTGCQVCMNGELVDSDDKCPTDSVCVDGVCSDPLTGNGCAKNSDCEEGYFCDFKGKVNCEKGPKGKNGTCTNRESFTRSPDLAGFVWGASTDWFSAKNFCLALNKRMASISDFNCPYTVEEYRTSDVEFPGGYCCKTKQDSINEQCGDNQNDKLAEIMKTVSGGYFWTKDLTKRSCIAFNMLGNSVYYNYRDANPSYGAYYALCK